MTELNIEAIEKAHNHFEEIHGGVLKANEEAKPIVPGLSQYGAVQYQTYQLNKATPELKNEVETGKQLMERFVAVASAAVLAKGGGDNYKNYDFNIWKEIVNVLLPAFFTDPISGNKSLNTTVKGIDVAKNVINFACSVIAGNVTAFASFLNSFGNGLSTEMKKTTADYNYLYSYSTHDLFKNESGVVFYKPNFLVYGTHFSQEQKKISTSCGSYNDVKLDFSVNTVGGTFRINEYMNNPTFKQQVDDFLNKFEGKSIDDADSYFSGIFDAQKDKSAMLT